MKIIVTLTLSFILATIAGCASLRKEIYFVDAKHFPTNKGMGYYGPGSNFDHGTIKIGATESIEIGVRVENSTQATYLLGIILPIVPVFWWPENKFSLKKENIRISCGAAYNSEKKYLDRVSDGTYQLSKEGVAEITFRENIGFDKCTRAILELPDGRVLAPLTTEHNNGSTLFSFDILATEVRVFKFKITSVQLATGEAVKTDFAYEARLLDWTRYILFSPL